MQEFSEAVLEEKIAALNKETEVIPQIPYEKRIYTVDEIQDILGISKTTAYNLVKLKVFHCVKVGGHYRVSKKSFDEWLDNQMNDCQVCETV